MKKTKPSNMPIATFGDGRLVYEYQIRNLEGSLLTHIESLGLPDKQETAFKEVFKGIFYRALYQESKYLWGDLTGEIEKQVAEVSENRHGTLVK